MTRFRSDLKYSDVTRHADFLNRRQLMAGIAGTAAFSAMAGPSMAALDFIKSPFSTKDKITSQEAATTYNNFYEFGLGKDDPARNAHKLTIDPWSIEIGGMVDKPGNYGLEDVLTGVQLEERIYRFRCVEAWSMVVPWIGFELKTLLDRVGVQSGAKYVAFETLERPSEMSGQNNPSFPWPYIEGLRMDEAMNPLTILSTGMYGEELPKQNGAPIRLVVPWKYGFKSIKSIVKITVLDKEPPTTWNNLAAREYGFYANVNPEVDHPRWSQASHRPIGGGLFAKREPTLMFNGYGEHVADLYKGMDLTRKF